MLRTGMRSLISFLFYFFVSLFLLVIGGWLTYLGLGDWYYDLTFPPFQPPAWVFTPAWVVVLSCLAVSTWLVTKLAMNNIRAALMALGLYGAQCVLNVGWSLLFFTLQRPDFALWELIALDLALFGMIWSYFRISVVAGVLLLPYIFWLGLSTAINVWIVMHNSFPVTPGV